MGYGKMQEMRRGRPRTVERRKVGVNGMRTIMKDEDEDEDEDENEER